MEAAFWDYKDKVVFDAEKANKVMLSKTAHSRTTLWCLTPGQRIAPHVHAGDHVWILLEGEGEYLGDGGPQPLSPGRLLVAPAGKSHGVENTGREGLVFVSVSAG